MITDRQQELDVIVDCFHLNPLWAYGNSDNMLLDMDALTDIEQCYVCLESDEDKAACLERFDRVRMLDEVLHKDLAKMVGVCEHTIGKWLSEAEFTTDCIKMMLTYCDQYGVDPVWLFRGEDKPFLQKRWYVVNQTEVFPNIGWFCVPEGFQIKAAASAAEVMKDYPPEFCEIDGDEVPVFKSERAIASYCDKAEAEKALRIEMRRIERQGKNAYTAPWSYKEVR